MFWNNIYSKLFVLCFVIKFGCSKGVKVTELNIPQLIDPRELMTLGCHYDMGKEELYSVKWYKDEEEFFRYTPRQQPHFMSFPVAGVHLVQNENGIGTSCDVEQCRVQLTRLSTTHSSGSYRCEVSTEAPTFRVAFEAGNVTVAVVGKKEPKVDGIRSEYSLNDMVHANCTAEPSDPAPTISWLINGLPAPSASMGQLRTAYFETINGPRLVIAHRDFRFIVEKKYFPTADEVMRVTCLVKPPHGVPAPNLSSTVTVQLNDPLAITAKQSNVLSNEKFAWPSSTDRNTKISHWLPTLAICLLFYSK